MLTTIQAAGRAERLAIGQFLALALAANVHFDLIHDRLVMCANNPNWNLWQPLRQCLDEIGIEALERYFRETTIEERAALSAAA